MGYWDIEMRYIVDVDGQLLAIDADIVDPATLLKKANQSVHQQLWLVRRGERLALHSKDHIRLLRDEVLFFETSDPSRVRMGMRLAA
jgi:hypothetical protein